MLKNKIADAKQELKKAKENFEEKKDYLFCLKVEFNQLKAKEKKQNETRI